MIRNEKQCGTRHEKTRAIDTAQQVEVTQIATGLEEFCNRIASSLMEASFERKRQLVELLIDRVVVVNEDVEIRYVIPTSPRGKHHRFCQLRTDYQESKQSARLQQVCKWRTSQDAKSA